MSVIGNQKWKDYLINNQYRLAERLTTVTISIAMQLRGLISTEEYHEIEGISNDFQKAAKIIDVVSTREQKDIFIKFCNVLQEDAKMQELSESLMKLAI